MGFYRLKLSSQINIIAITLLVIISTIMTTLVVYQMQKGFKQEAKLKAKSDLMMSSSLINKMFPGDWELREGKLYKGNTLMNEKTKLEEIGTMTGDLFALFQNKTRINTNVQGDSAHLVGMNVASVVTDTVFNQGQIYIGEEKFLGESYQTAYMPIKDKSGITIGIWAIGTSQTFFNDIYASTIAVHLIVLMVMLLITMMAFLFYTRKINQRLQIVTLAMEDAGRGDFTKTLEINSQDEIGQLTRSYNAMKSNLADIMGQVRMASEQVATSSDDLMASAHMTTKAINQATLTLNQVAIGAETTVNGAKESARAIEELAIGVQKIAVSSSIVSEESFQAANESERGNETVQKAVKQMTFIEQSVNRSANLTRQLGNRSKAIGKIAELITNISSRINLLALNATIEAARAGEHGRGFAVVANEVRKLAEQSSDSACQIDSLIQGIQEDSTQSVTAMDQVIVDVQSGKELVNEAGMTFQMILLAIQHVANRIQEVTAITEEISASSEGIAATVDETTRISEEASYNMQSIAASSEEQLASMDNVSFSADSLSKMAQELETLILKFKI